MRIYSNADFNDLSAQVGAEAAMLELLAAYKRSRDRLAEAINNDAPHRELESLRRVRSAARFALTRAIDPDQDARRARENIRRLEIRRKSAATRVVKLDGYKRMIAELKLQQIDELLEGQRWLLDLFSRTGVQ